MTFAWIARGQEFYREYAADEQFVATKKKEAKGRADKTGGVFWQHLRTVSTRSAKAN